MGTQKLPSLLKEGWLCASRDGVVPEDGGQTRPRRTQNRGTMTRMPDRSPANANGVAQRSPALARHRPELTTRNPIASCFKHRTP